MLDGVIQLATAFIGSLGFSLLFNVRKELLPSASFGGMVCWGVYMLADWIFGAGTFLPSLAAAAFATIYSEAMARVESAPATVFYIPALIPLVPGGSLYYTMSYAVSRDWAMVRRYGSSTFYCALGIAVGMSIVLAIDFTMRKASGRKENKIG